jgi:group I intron endonuclease
MNKICGIYKITSPSGKIYIGQSKDIKKRIYHYNGKLGIGQPKIHNSIIKYGWNMHIFEVIHECLESELNDYEKYYIKFYDTFNTKHSLNLNEGGNTIKMLNETKIKISNTLKGIKRSKETKIKISNAKKGVHTYFPSKQTRDKLCIAIKGLKRSKETKEKMSKSKTGLIHTDKTKLKISKTKSSVYKIYNQNNELFHKIHGNIKNELKKLNLPEHSFCNTYRNNEKIKRGKYCGWYIIKSI